MEIDRSKSALLNVLALVNTGSPNWTFQGTEFTAGVPAPFDGSPGDTDSNTSLELTAVVGQGFQGVKEVHYARLALGNTKPGAKQNYEITGVDTLATIKTQIAIEHNLIEDQFTLVGDLPAQGAGAEVFTLSAINGSLTHTGTHTVNVTFP